MASPRRLYQTPNDDPLSARTTVDGRSVPEVLAEIGRVITSSSDMNEVYDRFGELVEAILPVQRVALYTLGPAPTTIASTYVRGVPIPALENGNVSADPGNLIAQSLESCRGVLNRITDAQSASAESPITAAAVAAGLRVAIAAPLMYRSAPVGVLVLASANPDALRESDIETVEQIAAQISGAVANARLHAELNARADERARLAEELRREARQNAVLAEIGRIISSTLDVSAVYESFAEQVAHLIRFDRITISIVNEVRGTVSRAYVAGMAVPGAEAGAEKPLAGSLEERILATGQPVRLAASSHDRVPDGDPVHFIWRASGLRSLISAPLFVRGHGIGTLGLSSTGEDAYSERDALLLERIASQIAGAVANAELHGRVSRDRQEREAIARIGQLVGASLDLRTICDRLTGELKRLLTFDRLMLRLLDEGGESTTGAYASGVDLPRRPITQSRPMDGSLTGAAIRTRQPIRLTVTDAAEVLARFPQMKSGLDFGFRSFLAVPILTFDQVVGALILHSFSPDAYDEENERLLAEIAAHVGGAIANSKLMGASARESEERLAIAEIGRIASSTLNLQDVYTRFVEQAQKLIPFDRTVITLYDEKSQTISDAYVAGLEVPELPAGGRIRVSDSLNQEVIRLRQPRVHTEADLREMAKTSFAVESGLKLGLKSNLSVPLVWQDRLVGTLNFRSRQPDAYGSHHVGLAEQIGAQIAGAIATSSMYVAAQQEALEKATLAEIGRLISSTLDVRHVYPGLVEQVRKLIPFDRLVISVRDGEEVVDAYIAGREVPGYPEGGRHAIRGTLNESLMRDRRVIVMDKSAVESLSHVTATVRGLKVGLNSLMVVPLVWQDQVAGTLNFRSQQPAPFGEREIELGERVAAQIAGAIATARLYEQAQREGEIRAALAAISVAAGSDLSLPYVLERVADEIPKIIHYDRLAVTLLEPSSDILRVAFVRGISVAGFDAGRIVKYVPEEGWKWRTVLAQEPEPWDAGPMVKAGLNSWIEVPLGSRAAGPIGYLSLRSRTPSAYRQQDLELLERIATQVTPVIHNAITHRQALELAEERERRTTLEAQTRELERVNQAKSQFLSTVSHELKTPLTSIMAFTDILARDRDNHLSDKQKHQLDVVRRNARHLNVLISDLLDVSRIEAGRLALNKMAFSLKELFSEVVDDMRPEFNSRKQGLNVRLDKADIQITADRARVAQVLANLLSNASKYSPEKSSVDLSAALDGGHVVMRVRDHGIGISREDQVHLFAPFFRADNTLTRSVSGTGLGLAIVRRLVEAHGGTVTVESERDKGSEFTVRLPVG